MIWVDYPEPHFARTKQLLNAHPDLKDLFGHTPITALYLVGLVLAQVGLAWLLADASIWGILAVAYGVGAFANHALWVMIHECTHNLIFKRRRSNLLLQIFANLPIVFPSAIAFRAYHLKHHLHQGDMDRDADLPRSFEVNWVGHAGTRKALWQFFYFAVQIVRVPFIRDVAIINCWIVLNWLTEVAFLCGITAWVGWGALLYLALSSIFSIGLHPVGARWLQEHYVFYQQQETYSYYGPLNKVAFNVGYHNEHHDLMRVPWSRLPKVRSTAPEFYDGLYAHTSWTALLMRFLTDGKIGLFNRVVRASAVARRAQFGKSSWPDDIAA